MPAFAQRNQQLIAQGDSCVKAYDYFHALDFYQQAQRKFNIELQSQVLV